MLSQACNSSSKINYEFFNHHKPSANASSLTVFILKKNKNFWTKFTQSAFLLCTFSLRLVHNEIINIWFNSLCVLAFLLCIVKIVICGRFCSEYEASRNLHNSDIYLSNHRMSIKNNAIFVLNTAKT
jgi:hypothetical protein